MSFYKEIYVSADDWQKWLSGQCCISVDDDDFGCFHPLDVYDLRLIRQVNGVHDEDVVDACCCVIGDMSEVEPVKDLSRWYGGRYAEMADMAMYYAVHPQYSNDGITFLALPPDKDNLVLVAVGFGW